MKRTEETSDRAGWVGALEGPGAATPTTDPIDPGTGSVHCPSSPSGGRERLVSACPSCALSCGTGCRSCRSPRAVAKPRTGQGVSAAAVLAGPGFGVASPSQRTRLASKSAIGRGSVSGSLGVGNPGVATLSGVTGMHGRLPLREALQPAGASGVACGTTQPTHLLGLGHALCTRRDLVAIRVQCGYSTSSSRRLRQAAAVLDSEPDKSTAMTSARRCVLAPSRVNHATEPGATGRIRAGFTHLRHGAAPKRRRRTRASAPPLPRHLAARVATEANRSQTNRTGGRS